MLRITGMHFFKFLKSFIMQKTLILFFFFSLLGISSIDLAAQQTQDSMLYVIETVDGNRYVGVVLSQDGDKVQLRKKNLGDLTIQRDQISMMKPANGAAAERGDPWGRRRDAVILDRKRKYR